MSGWRRLYAKPAGSLPGGVVTQWGVGILALLVLGFLTGWIYLGGGADAELAPGTEPEQQAARSFQDRMAARVEEEALKAKSRRLAAERTLQQQRQQAAAGGMRAGRVNASDAMARAGASEDTGKPYTEEEWKLRERLRLEAIERRSRSLRSPPVAQTYRQADGRDAGAGPVQGTEDDAPAASVQTRSDAALERALDSFGQATAGLEAAAESALLQADPAPTASPGGAAPSAGPVQAPPSRDYTEPARVGAPEDPPGWERIHEGSFLEAALVTQLSGDFPGPVLAVVSVPFYSADRQRILVPRGARVMGTTQAVTSRDQSRLAVSFHRLLYPDGRWVSLQFHGLNQVGEGALKDRVNRHYLSLFTAVGAVGVLAGLTAQGGNPYEGGVAGFRAGTGQGLGQAAERILDRFLNRLPTLTIRAGHRLRVWFTSDVLVPRPPKGD